MSNGPLEGTNCLIKNIRRQSSEAFRYCQNKLVEYGYSHTGTKWTETIATAEANKLEAQIIESNLGLW